MDIWELRQYLLDRKLNKFGSKEKLRERVKNIEKIKN